MSNETLIAIAVGLIIIAPTLIKMVRGFVRSMGFDPDGV